MHNSSRLRLGFPVHSSPLGLGSSTRVIFLVLDWVNKVFGCFLLIALNHTSCRLKKTWILLFSCVYLSTRNIVAEGYSNVQHCVHKLNHILFITGKSAEKILCIKSQDLDSCWLSRLYGWKNKGQGQGDH